MGKSTKIDWCDATWNPVTGCLHGCEYCYARGIAERFRSQEIYDPELACQRHLIERGMLTGTGKPIELDYPWEQKNKDGSVTNAAYPFGFEPTLHRYRLGEPTHWTKPRTIFVCSMADLFGDWVPDEWIKAVFDACLKAHQHRYIFLTKNPKRYKELASDLDWYEDYFTRRNFWFGTTIEKPGIDFEFGSPYVNSFVSVEPLMGEPFESLRGCDVEMRSKWVIVGAETGNRQGKIIPKREWIDKITKKCEGYGAKVFMKESLRGLMGDDFRQEFPWETKL